MFSLLAVDGAEYEMRALHNPFQHALMMIALGATAMGLWAFNRYRASRAELYFEELPEELITTLGMISAPESK